MRKLTLLIFLSVSPLLSFNALAGSGTMNGAWRLSRDFHLDGMLGGYTRSHQVQCNSHHNKFTFYYIEEDASNDSIFIGETNSARSATVISFYQFDETYYVTHSGIKVGHNKFIGTWYDVTGNSGDFELEANID